MLTVTVLDPKAAKYKRGVSAAAKIFLAALKKEKTSLEIFLVGDKEMSKNVLAFPADASFPRPDINEPALGEIFLNPSYIEKNPVALPFPASDFTLHVTRSTLHVPAQLAYMLAHGILHLLGHDHEIDRDRMKMEKREAELLALLPQRK